MSPLGCPPIVSDQEPTSGESGAGGQMGLEMAPVVADTGAAEGNSPRK